MTVETPFRDFLAEGWDRYAERHAELLGYYDRALDGAMSQPDQARYDAVAGGLEPTFAGLDLERSAAEVFALLDVEPDTRVVAFVGRFTADAWVDTYGGEPVAFFALEVFDERHDPRVTAIHELAHVAHWHARGGHWRDDVAALNLMTEVITLATTRRLVPETRADQHFMVSDYAAWSASCDAAWRPAVDALLAVLDDRDESVTRRFFWPDWGRTEEDRAIPERIAYLMAARVGDLLLERTTLPEIARWREDRAAREVRAALEALR